MGQSSQASAVGTGVPWKQSQTGDFWGAAGLQGLLKEEEEEKGEVTDAVYPSHPALLPDLGRGIHVPEEVRVWACHVTSAQLAVRAEKSVSLSLWLPQGGSPQ